MISSDDKQTVVSLKVLRKAIAEQTKPIVLWIGAGASSWTGYPSWLELTRRLRREFFQFNSSFNNALALRLIEDDLPAFFQMCRDLDRARYFRWLTDCLEPPKCPSDLYQRFVRKVQQIQPTYVVTTNVDEMIEQSLGPIRVLQRTDTSLVPELLQRATPFIAKIHGSMSSVETMVFATKDYDIIRQDMPYLSALKTVFAISTIIFLGYGVRDQYVLDLLAQTTQEHELFGPGPHFVVTADRSINIPGLHRIVYRVEPHRDHRAALTVLDVVQQSMNRESAKAVFSVSAEKVERTTDVVNERETGYYITDFKPPGTWTDSETAEFGDERGTTGRLTAGLGFSNEELPTSESSAMHDLTVGLICFDRVYLPLISLSALFKMVMEDLLREIIEHDVLRFIHMVNIPAVVYEPDAAFGVLSMLLLGGLSVKPAAALQPGQTIPEMPVREMVERHISPIKGKEREANAFIEQIENKVIVFKYDDRSAAGFQLMDSLLMPHVSKLLGISDAIIPSQVPLWLKFPYLRLAHLVHTGSICTKLSIQAAKVPFGGPQLISAAFGVHLASEWAAEHVASYGISGRFNTNLGSYVLQTPEVIRKILNFRKSSEGHKFRKEVGQALLRDTGSEFSASVNAGLTRNIPPIVLQKGHDRLLSLMSESAQLTPVPAVWTNQLSDDSTLYWRRTAQKTLLQICRLRGISRNDHCICGSGDKLRLCCLLPLNC